MIRNAKSLLPVAAAALLLLSSTLGAAAADQPPPAIAPPPVAAVPATTGTRIRAEFRHELARVQPWLDRYGDGAVALAVGIEGVGIPAPGQTLLVAAVLDAAARPGLNIGWLLLIAFLAAAVGNSLGYLIGRVGGRALLRRLRLDERNLQRVGSAFERWGGWLIVGARFFDGLRQVNGIAAGILEMPWWRFTRFNLLGAALWVGVWGLGVYYLEEHLHAILALVHRANPWVAGGTVVGLVLVLAVLWLGARRVTAPDRPAGV